MSGRLVEAGKFDMAKRSPLKPDWAEVAFSPLIVLNCAESNGFQVIIPDNRAFRIVNPVAASHGLEIQLQLINTSGGAPGALTWGTKFKTVAATTAPANNRTRLFSFWYDEFRDAWWQLADDVVV